LDIRDETPREASRDEAELARFGYRQELKRSLGLFSSFAVAFSYISPTTGIFALFGLGLSTIGGVFFWSWPIVAAGQFIIALSFAEVASHIPVAGSVYQWAKYLSTKTHSWFTGWIYLFAGILTITAVAVTLPIALIPALNGMGWHLANSAHNQRLMALLVMGVVTLLNVYGVKAVALINNVGVLFEILGMVVFAFVMALFHNHQGVGVIVHSGTTNVTTSTFLLAMFMSLFVIYGFDTAATLAEETRNPRKEAPKAILYSIVGAFVIGGIFIWATLMAVPNLNGGIKGAFSPAAVIDANFSNAFATTYLVVVSIAIFICLLSIQANVMRLCFGMARDEQLPASRYLRTVSPKLHTPWVACLVVTLLAAIPLAQYAGAGILGSPRRG
jgi:amino acid transporter